MSDTRREIAREMASKYISAGDPLGWFEALYARAAADISIIPWADLALKAGSGHSGYAHPALRRFPDLLQRSNEV